MLPFGDAISPRWTWNNAQKIIRAKKPYKIINHSVTGHNKVTWIRLLRTFSDWKMQRHRTAKNILPANLSTCFSKWWALVNNSLPLQKSQWGNKKNLNLTGINFIFLKRKFCFRCNVSALEKSRKAFEKTLLRIENVFPRIFPSKRKTR